MSKARDISKIEDWQVAKAWVVFTSTTGALLSSHNVTSVTRTAAGTYNINFETAFPNKNYCVVALPDFKSGITNNCTIVTRDVNNSTTSCQILTAYGSNVVADLSGPVRVLVFADT